QRSDQVKEGVGYNAVPPLAADLYRSPKKDLSWTGLPEFADDTGEQKKLEQSEVPIARSRLCHEEEGML
nr:hypothetical protein [Tanacetum cinerariifolium]